MYVVCMYLSTSVLVLCRGTWTQSRGEATWEPARATGAGWGEALWAAAAGQWMQRAASGVFRVDAHGRATRRGSVSVGVGVVVWKR